ncbi:MAG: hypothetical protein WEB07_02280, partial [Natronospirillum sp.]
TVQRHYRGAEPGIEALNLYLNATANRVWNGTLNRLETGNASAVTQLQREIAQQQTTLRMERQTRLFELAQNIAIARSLDIELPTTPQRFGRQPNNEREVYYTNIGTDGTLPLYFLGYRTLEAEQATLEEGIDVALSDEFIRMAQERLRERQYLAEVFAEDDEFAAHLGVQNYPVIERLVTVLEYPTVPISATGPRKIVALAVAGILGGFLGLLMAGAVRFYQSVARFRATRAVKPPGAA